MEGSFNVPRDVDTVLTSGSGDEQAANRVLHQPERERLHQVHGQTALGLGGLELDTIAAVVILGLTGLAVWIIYHRGR
jgi:hypothetical protein